MFKNKGKFHDFVKKQIARVMAVIMAFSSFASTGLALSTVQAAEQSKNDYAQSFIKELVQITADGTKYEWGGWLNPNVDCRGFVRAALRNAYGLDIQFTAGYLVDEDGNAVDKNGKIVTSKNDRVYIDVAAYDAVASWKAYVGKRICVEGNGKKTYYRVAVADTIANLKDGGGNRWSGLKGQVLDVSFNGHKYSSMIAYACQFPGTIIRHNGHYGVGLGEYHSKEEIINAYPDLNGPSSGSEGGEIIRWSQSAYNLGNSYDEDDPRYWFGKTVFLSACSKKSGIRADNFTTTGKTATPDGSSHMAILICESKQETVEVSFEKYDQATKKTLAGAQYGVYSDSACTKLVTTFTTKTTPVKVVLEKDVYYVKELKAPTGYSLSKDVVPVDATKESSVTVKLYDTSTYASVFVRKVDAHSPTTYLSGTKFTIQEYNKNTGTYVDLLQLKYVNTVQAFVINGEYTNNEGTTYSDDTLHYTQTNLGKFKIIETKSQSGYQNNGFSKEFNIKDGALRLVGDQAVENTAMLSLLIKKVNMKGEPLAGAKFIFEYNGQKYRGTTDAKGELLFTNIPEGPTNTGILKEIEAPDGYVIMNNYLAGQSIALKKDTVKNGCYMTTIQVVNGTEQDPPPEVTKGTIVISKVDTTRVDDFKIGVPNAYYTVYTDEALTKVAQDQNGKKLERLKTGSDGKITINDLDLGVYYIREVEAPNGYAIQMKVFSVNLLADYADENGVVTVTTKGIGDPRQIVLLSLQKLDAANNNPVPGAVYALYTDSDVLTSTTAQTVKKNTLIGYYKTDANGMINVDRFGTAAFEANGRKFNAVTVKSVNGTVVNDDALVNGSYYFIEVSAPSGYILNKSVVSIDAPWAQNKTANEVKVAGGVVGPAGQVLTMNTVVVKDTRQSMTISFEKVDKTTGNNKVNNKYYNLNDYQSAVNNNLVATLQGAKYQLFNTSNIVDINTGDLIPAGTLLGIYTTDANGKFTISKFNVGTYKNHKLPVGAYKLIESVAPQGYAINTSAIAIAAPKTSDTEVNETIATTAKGSDEILKQAITIKKVSNSGAPLAGAKFKLYHVADVIEACGINKNELPWNMESDLINGFHSIDREKFEKLISNGKLVPAADDIGQTEFTTNANGVVTTGKFVYGDYILYEASAPNDYKPTDAIYIQIPSVGVYVELEEYFVHDVDEQPTKPFEQTVINNPIPKTTFTVQKVWKDNNDQYGLRPSNISVQLYANGVPTGKTVILSSSNNWKYTWNDLLVYDANDKAINYTVDEVSVPEHYSKSVNGGTITNTCTYVPEKTTVTVTKQWNDNNDQYGLRPESVDVALYADGKLIGTATLTKTNNWSFTWSNLNKYQDDRTTKIIYTVDEVSVPEHYSKSINGTTITNTCTYVPEKTTFTVNKIWNDNNNQYGLRPTSISVQLYANGKPLGGIITITAKNNWTYTWTDLMKHSDIGKTEIVYTVKEVVTPTHYSQSVDGGTITNTCTYSPEKTTFTVVKVWDDNNNQYGLRPQEISVQLYANGSAYGKAIVLNEKNNWTYTWSDLMKHSDAGITEIQYTVDEIAVPTHYKKSISGGTITNTCTYVPEKTDFTVNKVWNDNNNEFGLRPDSIVVQLYADGIASGSPITLSANNGWSYTWNDLLKGHVNGADIVYTVDELSAHNYYEKTVNGNTITNTCTYVPEKTDFVVNKIWEDNNNKYGLRPINIQVQLFANGKAVGNPITLSQDNDWTYIWTDLMKHSDIGVTEIVYTVDEVAVPEHYSKSVNGGTITNTCTYVPEKTTFTVVKIWNDNNNYYGLRPEMIEVQLFANGIAIGDVVTLSADNNWTYTWVDLFKHSDAGLTEIIYTVDEIDIPEHYAKSVVGTQITNTCTYVPEKTSFTVIKVWDDNNNEYGFRPDTIKVQLYADGKPYGEEILLSAADDWTYTWTDLMKHSDIGKTEIVYTVDEINVPEQYDKVVNDNVITNKCTYIKTSVIISKYEIIVNEKHAVPGATLQILDADGNVVVLRDGTKCEWITGLSNDVVDEYGVSGHLIDHLPAGTYTLHEAATPDGYATADDVVFTVKETTDIQYVHLIENPIVVQFNKLDAESNVQLSGAEMVLLNEDKEPVLDINGNIITWITNGDTHQIERLPVGTYYLREIKAPFGYQKAEDVQFTVVDTAEPQVVTMHDTRTVGQLEINKIDANTKQPLENVVFDVISVDDVVDPITGELIFSANQIIETLITDSNGYAKMSNCVPIGIYGYDGFERTIKYHLVETQPANGQYNPLAVNRIFEFTYVDDETPIVKLTYEIENAKPEIVVNKTGVPTTFVGEYENKHDITVIKNGDLITYTITVKNTGLASAWNIVVRDFIPANSTFVEMDANCNGLYDSTKNCVYWTIDELKAGDSVELTFIVKAESDIACEIVNIAQYAMPSTIPEREEDFLDPKNDNNAWLNTNSVVHQIVTISKDSSIDHGVDETDATRVDVGTQFTYIITFECTNPVYGFTMCDQIPNGLSFVSGTAKYQTPGSDPVVIDNMIVGDDNVITFPTIDELADGTTTFYFDVVVNEVEKYNTDYYFVNKAMASMQSSKDSDAMVELETNTISNQTFVPNPFDDIPQTGDDLTIVVYSTIACISAMAMIAFGIYGYCDERKSRR